MVLSWLAVARGGLLHRSRPRIDASLPFIDPRIFTAPAHTRADDVPVIAVFRDADQLSAFKAQRTRAAGFLRVQSEGARYLPYAAVRLLRADVEGAARRGAFQSVWLDALCTTCLDKAGLRLDLPAVRTRFDAYGQGLLLGFADTGLDSEHPDLRERVEGFRNFVDDSDVRDPDGHGTHVASVACGSGEASNGRYAGVAPRARMLAARVLRRGGAGRMSRVMQGIEWLAASGAHVINLSVGTEASALGSDPLALLCAQIVKSGVVIAVAAGNSGPLPRTIGSPGSAEPVITVGGSDLTDQILAFSSRGPTPQGLLKPDLLAPGQDIVAARAQGTYLGDAVDAAYTRMSGTSMATPLVSGLCALMLEMAPQMTAAEIKAVLQLNCVSLNQPATAQGAGRVQAFAALHALHAAPERTPDASVPAQPPAAPVPPLPQPAGCLAPRVGRLLSRRSKPA